MHTSAKLKPSFITLFTSLALEGAKSIARICSIYFKNNKLRNKRIDPATNVITE